MRIKLEKNNKIVIIHKEKRILKQLEKYSKSWTITYGYYRKAFPISDCYEILILKKTRHR